MLLTLNILLGGKQREQNVSVSQKSSDVRVDPDVTAKRRYPEFNPVLNEEEGIAILLLT
jgi:hypothetical protein